MGLNDDFFTLPTQAEDDAENKAAHVKVFAPSAPGEAPELLQSVEFIAVPDEEIAEDNVALEAVSIALRDLQLFGQQLRENGGISMNMAVESMSLMPGLVTKDIPKEFYTEHVSRTMYAHALEQEGVETKSLMQRALAIVRGFFKKVTEWFASKFSKSVNKEKVAEVSAKEKELEEKLKAAEEKAAKMAEDFDQLQKASTGELESYKQQLEAQGLQLREVQSQMRNLDSTKNAEIAAHLDSLEALQRKAQSSRQARLQLETANTELKLVVAKAVTKELTDRLTRSSSLLKDEYSAFAVSRVAASPIVAKYMLGNGIQQRSQMILKYTNFLDGVATVNAQLKKLREGLANVETNPQPLLDTLKGFDPRKITDVEIVFQKNEPNTDEIKGDPGTRINVWLTEMSVAAEKAHPKVAGMDFAALQKELQDTSAMLDKDNSLKQDYKFVNLVVEAYRGLHKQVSQLLPLVQKFAQVAHDLTYLSSACKAAKSNSTAFLASSQYTDFCNKVLPEVCAQIGVSQNFINPGDVEVRGHVVVMLSARDTY